MGSLVRRILLRIWRILSIWQPLELWLTARINTRFLVGVLGIFENDEGKILILDHGRYRRTHPWGLPGGWHQPGESLTETIRREMNEETGLAVSVDGIFQILTAFRRPRVEVVATGSVSGGTPRLNDEISGVRYLGKDDDLSILNARHRRVVERYFAGETAPVDMPVRDIHPDETL